MRRSENQKGKASYDILSVIGMPTTFLLLIFLLRGCT
jgi:hypothetical protein